MKFTLANWPYATRSEDPPPDPWSYRLPAWSHGIKRWEWSFGDLTAPVVEDIIAEINDDGDPCINAITEHTYEYPDLYPLTLTVTDDDAFEGGGEDRYDQETYDILAFDLDISTSGGDEGYLGVDADREPIYLWFYPQEWPYGQVELSVVGGAAACVEVWDASQKGQGNRIIPSGFWHFTRVR